LEFDRRELDDKKDPEIIYFYRVNEISDAIDKKVNTLLGPKDE
jgi:hypothetical protein